MDEILRARERRWHLRRDLAKSTGKTIVACGLVAPGVDKNPFWGDMVFRHMRKQILRSLKAEGFVCALLRDDTTVDGRFILLSVDGPSEQVKKTCVAIEDTHPLGRLVDIDVLNPDGNALGRADMGLPPRRCLVCDAPAHQCVRAARHDLTNVQEQIYQILLGFATSQWEEATHIRHEDPAPERALTTIKQPGTRLELAITELERMIFSGELESGSHIKELEIASKIGISRGVAREAFISLAQSGLVEIFPHRGVFVRSFTYKETLDFYDLRAHMALMAVRQAAMNITQHNINQLNAILDRIDGAQEEPDPTELMTLNWNFHLRIYDSCDNNALKEQTACLQRKQFLACRHSFRVPTTVLDSNSEHRVILDYLSKRDGDRAAQAMHDHIMQGKRRFQEAIGNKAGIDLQMLNARLDDIGQIR